MHFQNFILRTFLDNLSLKKNLVDSLHFYAPLVSTPGWTGLVHIFLLDALMKHAMIFVGGQLKECPVGQLANGGLVAYLLYLSIPLLPILESPVSSPMHYHPSSWGCLYLRLTNPRLCPPKNMGINPMKQSQLFNKKRRSDCNSTIYLDRPIWCHYTVTTVLAATH